MGAPVTGIKASGDASAEALLSAFKDIPPAEMRRHATVFNYWLSIRGDRQFPPIRDLDPLEISDAGPCSVLLEMIGGGEDADVRHLGQSIKMGLSVEKASDAPRPSLLSVILDKLPIVASSREAFAFEDEFESDSGLKHCWITLLPFSATGTWIDYVYGFVSLHPPAEGAEPAAEAADVSAPQAEAVEEPVAEAPAPVVEPEPEVAATYEPEEAYEPQPEPEVERKSGKAGFSAKLFESLASVGFYGRVVDVEPQPAPEEPEWEPEAELQPEPAPAVHEEPIVDQVGAEEVPAEAVDAEPVAEVAEPEVAPAAEAEPEPEPVIEAEPEEVAELEPEPVAEVAPEPEAEPAAEAEVEPIPQSETQEAVVVTEGLLQTKLTEVRAKADEARMAKIRANAALYEGLSAAYDFALDAEDNAEEYLKMVESQGLKIQLRSPMKPVVKLAFDGICDDSTIAQLEAVLAWALKHDLPRGSLAKRIEEEGGLGPILNGQAQAA